MELEKQVCSLELSKRLKELGVKQYSLYSWNKQKYGSYLLGNNPNYDCNIIDECISSFTVAELGEMLPKEIFLNGDLLQLCFFYSADKPNCNYFPIGEIRSVWKNINAENEANARASMFIYLIEKELIEVKK